MGQSASDPSADEARRPRKRAGRKGAKPEEAATSPASSSTDESSTNGVPRAAEAPPAPSSMRWALGLGVVAAAAGLAWVLKGDPAGPAASASASRDPASSALRAEPGARVHDETRDDGRRTLVLEDGVVRGTLGAADGPHNVTAGPYRVTGDARVEIRWSDSVGLQVGVSAGEARIMVPDKAPVVITAGGSRTLPPTP